MNPAHLHLMLVHFPIAGAFFALPVLVWALLRKGEVGATAAAGLILALSGAAAIAANRTGEGAEEVVEGEPGVTERAIEEHEERAEVATVLSALTGLVGLGAAGLALAGRSRIATGAVALALVADLGTAGAMAWTGNAGGAIRHPEIGSGAQGPSASREPSGGLRLGEEEEEDD